MVSAAPKLARPKYTLRLLPTDKLVPTEDNTRRPITQASVESLARSMARDGVLQPIVVRPHPEREGRWEIRAGERRWRAAQLAGLKEMPAIVRPLDDESALTVTIAENLLRLNLHPLEEAAGIQQALDKGHDPKKLAARLGKSMPFVLRRASLTRLSKTWQVEVLRSDSDASRLSVAHLELIARLPEETQDVLAENGLHRVFARGFPTVDELRRVIEDGLRTLVSMPWKLDDETLDPKSGACLNCPKRSGMQPALFDNDDAPKDGKVSKTDRCLDPACFDRKQTAFVLQRENELRQEHPDLRLVQIGFDGVGPAAAAAFGDRVTRLYSPRIVKNGNPSGTPAMQVAGPKAGTLIRIDFDDGHANGQSRKTSRPKDADGKPIPMPLEERKARLQKRRDAFLVSKVLDSIRALTPETLTTTIAELSKRSDEAAKHFNPLALVLAFGTSTRANRDHGDEPWTRYEQLRLRKGSLPVTTALHEVVQVWASRLGGSHTHHITEQAADARRICAILGIDAAAIETDAAVEIPTPASWAALDGTATAQSNEPAEPELSQAKDRTPPVTPKASPRPRPSPRGRFEKRPNQKNRSKRPRHQ